MHESHQLIWISPVIPQVELEGLHRWIETMLQESGARGLTSFSRVQTSFCTEPEEALRLQFNIEPGEKAESIAHFKEAIWSEVFARSQPAPLPFALALLPARVLSSPKKLFCFDMDSTLINEEVIDEIARLIGAEAEVSRITEQAMKGELDFKESLRARVQLFRGMKKTRVLEIIPGLHVSPGGEKLLAHLRSLGIKTSVMSGGFDFILRHFEKVLSLDHVFGNSLITDEADQFTGDLDPPLVDAEYKQKLVAQLKSNYGFSTEETVVVGDGANDILMTREAGVSVSFCGKMKLSAVANTLVLKRNLFWLKSILS